MKLNGFPHGVWRIRITQRISLGRIDRAFYGEIIADQDKKKRRRVKKMNNIEILKNENIVIFNREFT